MSGFPILDLVVGIIFIYFLLSIICSSAVEIALTMGKFRAKMLEKWLMNIFDKEVIKTNGEKVKLGQAIMDHCSLSALSPNGKATSYIHAKNFTEALLEKVSYDLNNPKSIAHDLDDLIASIQSSKALPDDLQRVLLSYANESKNTYRSVSVKTVSEVELFKSKIENWFDSNMDRVGGALKTHYVRPFTFWIAFCIAIFFNADSISIAKYLYSNPSARAEIAAQAYAAADNDALKAQVNQLRKANVADDSVTHSMAQLTDTITARVNELKIAKAALNDTLPLGWNERVFNDSQGKFSWLLIPSKLAGLAATILAMMMGAPFWFDLLNKIANLRGTGKKPEESEKK
ncbi:MAG: hypothetical protein JWN56_1061 [Sphingobacteriales bacterium]|nr:hypothetical protein [Sphingobacteriales bacterium]